MQVSCPSCAARYAVDAAAIGSAGRMVECVRCSHRWFQPPGTASSQPPLTAPSLVSRPAPGTAPPSFSPPAPSRWGTWLAIAGGIALLLGTTAYAYRAEIAERLPPAWRTLVTFDALRGAIQAQARTSRRTPALSERFELDLAASRVELVEERYVLTGELVNAGTMTGSTKSLTLVFRAGEKVIGKRTVALVAGPIAPGSRARFSLALDEPPAGATSIVPSID